MTLTSTNEGTYYDYLKSVIEESLNNFLEDTSFTYTPSSGSGEGGPGGGSGDGPGGDPPSGDPPSGDPPDKSRLRNLDTYETAADYIASLNANKDVYFSLFCVWLVMILFSLIHNKEKKVSIKKCILLFVILLLMSLFRNNGIYLVYLLFPFLFFYLKKNRVKILSIFGLVIVLFLTYQNVLLPHFKITPGSDREKLSIFFQQTARTIKYHEKDISEEDKEIIDKVLDYDVIKKKYNPNLADPVKNTYRLTVTSEDKSNYYKVWLKGFLKHPYTYVDATINNTYGYFDPLESNWYVYTEYCDVVKHSINYHYNSLRGLRGFLTIYEGVMHRAPVIGLITSIGFYVFILLSMSIYLLFKKKYKYLIVLNPLLVSLLVCIASPANTYFRYAMPIIFSIPVVVGMWLVIDKRKEI